MEVGRKRKQGRGMQEMCGVLGRVNDAKSRTYSTQRKHQQRTRHEYVHLVATLERITRT